MNTEDSEKIKQFINEYTAKETIRQHQIALKKYFTHYNKNPDNYIKDIRNMDNGPRNKVLDQYEHDISQYRNHLINEGYSPKCIHNYMSSVKMLLEHYRIDLDKAFWKKLHKRGIEKTNEAICDFKIPTTQQLKEILTHANTKPRAMFLLQASSGMRIGEICNITKNDIDLNYEYPHIVLRDTKTRSKGRTRCSPEAKEAILEFLKTRKDNNDPRLFQCKPKTARNMWNRLLKKSKYTDKDKTGKYERNKMGTHTLRKYFRNEFSKYNNDLAAYLMNQRTGLDRKYRDWSDEYLDQEYCKGVSNVLVFQSNVTDERLTDLNDEVKELKTENEKLKDDLRLLQATVRGLQNSLDIKDMKKKINP
jgi:integrase